MTNQEKIGIHVTFNGMPVYSLSNLVEKDSTYLISALLHSIDTFATRSRKEIGRSTDFLGYAFVDETEVSVMEVTDEKWKSIKNEGRLFIETPFGKIPSNNRPILALLAATRDTISNLNNKNMDLSFQPEATAEFFEESLKNMGYTQEKVMSELGRLKESRSNFLGHAPISLFIIEKNGDSHEAQEIGKYNEGKLKFNSMKDDEENFKSELCLLINVVATLKSYKKSINIEKTPILLRFNDYMLEVTYNRNDLPIVGVLIKGQGNPEDVYKYREDIEKLLIG